MQLKKSLILLTALTAGSATARLHGHERRHHHEKRGADMVYATINGAIKSWVNDWSGGAAAATTSSATTEEATVATAATSVIASVSAVPTADSSSDSSSSTPSVEWYSHPSDGQYTRQGFGGKTSSSGGGGTIFYSGNVGDPWGSNIIEVTAQNASQYKHVVEFKSSNTDAWTVVFWNKIGPDGKLTGWYSNSALKFTLEAGETRYVAFDDDTQGGWGAAKGDDLPTDEFGGYSCTWGEFDFSSSANNGWSGWDVSAIQAQAAKQDVQGMKICTHDNQKCSSITGNAASVINAYTEALKTIDGIGGNSQTGAIRLSAQLDFNE